ncbi:hypothetical protein D3C87_1642700 [compost metagenome]
MQQQQGWIGPVARFPVENADAVNVGKLVADGCNAWSHVGHDGVPRNRFGGV